MNLATELQTKVDVAGILGEDTLGRLSDEERRIAAVQHVGRDLILERDVEINAGDLSCWATLRAYGRRYPAYAGNREQPAEPAHCSIDMVTLQGSDVVEVDITNAMSEAALEQIHEAIMGDCE